MSLFSRIRPSPQRFGAQSGEYHHDGSRPLGGFVMRIDRLELLNFKKFASLDLELHPRFTLLIGENGAGKTSVLDALAVSLGVWLVEPPDSTLLNSRRGIYPSE